MTNEEIQNLMEGRGDKTAPLMTPLDKLKNEQEMQHLLRRTQSRSMEDEELAEIQEEEEKEEQLPWREDKVAEQPPCAAVSRRRR